MCKLTNWILFFILISLMSCAKPEYKYQEFVGEAQGTTFYISYSDSNATDYSGDIYEILNEFDNQVSTYKPNSIINQFNNNTIDSIFKLKHPYLFQSFFEAVQIKAYSTGYFDVGLYPVIKLIKSSNNLLQSGDSLFDSVMSIEKNYGWNNSTIAKLDSRSQFSFDAIAQGYSVDVLSEFFDSKGVENYMVEIGGELRVKGKNPKGELWTVSLESPNSKRDAIAVQETIRVDNKSVVTSGSYRKFKEIDGKRYSHAINPKSGVGVTHNLLSVSVVTEKASVADGLATAFLVMGKEKTIQLLDSNNRYNVSLLFIESDSNGNFMSSYYGGFEEMIVK
jgi:FAD:protein FMN transferase